MVNSTGFTGDLTWLNHGENLNGGTAIDAHATIARSIQAVVGPEHGVAASSDVRHVAPTAWACKRRKH